MMKKSSEFFYKLYHYEYWPSWLFYLPVYLLWPYFSIKGRSFFFFTVANPCIPLSGSFGESKSEILKQIHPDYLPQTQIISTEAQALGISLFPVVAKPDIGERGDHVTILHSQAELLSYFLMLKRPFLIQEYLSSDFEAGVMAIRDPETRKLWISSIAVKDYLKVKGDGVKSLEELVREIPRAYFQWERLKSSFDAKKIIKKDEILVLEKIGNHCRGTTFLNAKHLITKELALALEEALSPMKDFYFGRFDLKANSPEDLAQGKTIKIMELNGAFSEPGHIYDPSEKLLKSWADLISHWNYLSNLCQKNIKKGFKPSTFSEFLHQYLIYRKIKQ